MAEISMFSILIDTQHRICFPNGPIEEALPTLNGVLTALYLTFANMINDTDTLLYVFNDTITILLIGYQQKQQPLSLIHLYNLITACYSMHFGRLEDIEDGQKKPASIPYRQRAHFFSNRCVSHNKKTDATLLRRLYTLF